MIPASLKGFRYILGSVENGNLIDGTNDKVIGLTWLRRFTETNMSLFDMDKGVEYWYDEGRLHNTRINTICVVP